MIIHSDFQDFYDTCDDHRASDSVVFERYQWSHHILRAQKNIIKEYNGVPVDLKSGFQREKRFLSLHLLSIYEGKHIIGTRECEAMIGFCGKFYPIYYVNGTCIATHTKLARYRHSDNPRITYTADFTTESTMSTFYRYKIPYYLFLHNPCYSQIVVSPILEDYDFFNVGYGYQKYRDIEQFLSTTLKDG